MVTGQASSGSVQGSSTDTSNSLARRLEKGEPCDPRHVQDPRAVTLHVKGRLFRWNLILRLKLEFECHSSFGYLLLAIGNWLFALRRPYTMFLEGNGVDAPAIGHARIRNERGRTAIRSVRNKKFWKVLGRLLANGRHRVRLSSLKEIRGSDLIRAWKRKGLHKAPVHDAVHTLTLNITVSSLRMTRVVHRLFASALALSAVRCFGQSSNVYSVHAGSVFIYDTNRLSNTLTFPTTTDATAPAAASGNFHLWWVALVGLIVVTVIVLRSLKRSNREI